MIRFSQKNDRKTRYALYPEKGLSDEMDLEKPIFMWIAIKYDMIIYIPECLRNGAMRNSQMRFWRK